MSRFSMDVIQAEHRSIGVVLNGLLYLARSLRQDTSKPDYRLMRAMLHYVDVFPERFHHPKEDRYLFAKLRQRTQAADEAIARLEEEHTRGDQKVRWLVHAVMLLEQGGKAHLEDFLAKVEAYALFHAGHVALEEELILPLAQEVLTEEDWREIDAAFANAAEPETGPNNRSEFDRLFHQIVNLLPPAQIRATIAV